MALSKMYSIPREPCRTSLWIMSVPHKFHFSISHVFYALTKEGLSSKPHTANGAIYFALYGSPKHVWRTMYSWNPSLASIEYLRGVGSLYV